MRMDLNKTLAALTVKEDLFKDVRFYITGNASEQVIQFLVKGGARQEVHITDFMTHLITGKNPNENDIEEVRDIYQKPVVTLNWIVLSAKCRKLLPTEGFDPDSSRIFHGVKASLSKIPNEDISALWALITYYGGTCVLHFDHTCTHLVLGDLKGVKLQRALERGVIMVTPDWVTDSVGDGERKDEFYYHPRLLNLSPSSSPFPESAYVKPPNETRRKREKSPSKEPEPVYSVPNEVKEPVFQEIKADTKKTFLDDIQSAFSKKSSKNNENFFDSLVFSEEEDDGSDPEKKSLLDQLKCAQTWKDSSSSSSPVSTVEVLTTATSSTPNILQKISVEDASDLASLNSPPALDSNMLSTILDDDDSSSNKSRIDKEVLSQVLPETTVNSSVSTTIIKQTMYSSPDVTFASARMTPRTEPLLKSVPEPATTVSVTCQQTPTSSTQIPMSSAVHQVQSATVQNSYPSPIGPTMIPSAANSTVIPRQTTQGFFQEGTSAQQSYTQTNIRQNVVNSAQDAMVQPARQMTQVSTTPQPVQQQGDVPGTLVQLPPGMTPHQLNMMSPDQRQAFLERLHQKQSMEQRAHGVHPMQYKALPQNMVRFSQVRHAQPSHPGGWTNQQRPQTNIPQNFAQQQMKPQNWPQQGQIPPQSPQQYTGLSQAGTPTTTTQVQMIPGQHLQQVRQPVQRVMGQQFVTQGTRVNPNWQGAAQNTVNSTQNSSQFQMQVQQLKVQFPFLSAQEAQQLIQTIPGHIREMQGRDLAGRTEYLSQLEPRESQVVSVVSEFFIRKQQQQMVQRQQQMKAAVPQQSPTWQQPQFVQRPMDSRSFRSATPIVSPGQSSPHVPNQMVQPLGSPHNTIQRQDIVHPPQSPHQNLVNQSNLVKPNTKTALANLLTNRLSVSGQQGVISQAPQGAMEVQPHMIQKPMENVQGGHSSEQLVLYQRRPLGPVGNAGPAVIRQPNATGYVRSPVATPTPAMASTPAAYPRLHLYGHDVNMLPRELCMMGCVFYIADYYRDLYDETVERIKENIEEHGGEVVTLYDSARVTHVLCKHQKSPVFQQAVRENKRCITIYWLNDILIRGKMAPPWQAIHLPTPFADEDKPLKNMIIALTGFENDEKTTIKMMLNLAGAKATTYFSKENNALVCKKFEGIIVNKAKEWKKPVVNGLWLSEVLLGQNAPPLVYYATRYQHYLDDPLRIDPSLASHLFGAWKFAISVSKEAVDKAKTIREKVCQKRKIEPEAAEAPPEKKPKLEMPDIQSVLNEVPLNIDPIIERPRIAFSSVKKKQDLEKIALHLGGAIVNKLSDATHLVMGSDQISPRTVKFMCGVSTAKYIVTCKWLKDSLSQRKFLLESNYQVPMREFEEALNFKLTDTLQKENRHLLLSGKTFYMTPSVIPGPPWLTDIITAAGGTVDPERRSVADVKEKNKDGLVYFILACDKDSHLVSGFHKEQIPVFNPELVMTSILRQSFDVEDPFFRYVEPPPVE